MSIWDLRQTIESTIPAWIYIPIAVVFVVAALYTRNKYK